MWSREIPHPQHYPSHGKSNRKASTFARVRSSGLAFPQGLMWCQPICKRRVLLVDADAESRYQMRSWLFFHFEVLCLPHLGGTAEEALRFNADFIVLRGTPDNARNKELLRQLRAREALARLPVLWLSETTQISRQRFMDKVHEILDSLPHIPPAPPESLH